MVVKPGKNIRLEGERDRRLGQETGNDFTDGELEGAMLKAEHKSQPRKLEGQIKPKQQQKTDSFYDDDFDISTQEFRELVD